MTIVNCKDCHNENCRECGNYMRSTCWAFKEAPKLTTNYDRIRAKSDDEMASWLALHPCLPNCPAQTDECFKSSKFENCKKQWLNWLKQASEAELV